MEMEHPADAPRPQRRAVIAVLRIVFVASLIYLITLLVRLPVEGASASASRFLSHHDDVVVLLESLRRMRSTGQLAFDEPGSQAFERLRRNSLHTCSPGPVPEQGSVPERGSMDAAFAPLLQEPAVPGSGPITPADVRRSQLLDAANVSVLAADLRAQSCLRAEVRGFVARAHERRDNALVAILLLALTGATVVYLRYKDRERLRNQVHFSEQLIDAIPLPLSLRSPTGDLLMVNRTFEQRMGVKREAVLGRNIMEALPARSAALISDTDARAVASADPVSGTFEVMTHEGPRYIQARVQAIRRLDGSLVGTVGVQTDITDIKRSEAQLLETNAKLSQMSIKMIGAQEGERRRIARDLHDQVGQILTALKLQLASLAKRERIDLPAVAFVTPIELAEEALRHTRDLSASLHPHLLDDLGIEAALNSLIDRFIRPNLPGVELRCRLEPLRGPEAIELVAFRVVQEALTNVVRHAQATRVGVILEGTDGELALEVMDDGLGFEAGQSWLDLQRTASVGVSSMRDRVTEAGGEFRIESAPGAGTIVRARLPWRSTTAEKEHANPLG